MKTLLAAPLRLLLFTALWWVLSEGALADWPLVLPTVLVATGVSLLLLPPGSTRWRPLALLRFLPYFLWQSFLGGLDVARRALSPALPLAPGFIDVPLYLKGEATQAFFVWAVSLMPGTAGAELLEGTLKVHVLDTGRNNLERLRELEAYVAALFSEAPDA